MCGVNDAEKPTPVCACCGVEISPAMVGDDAICPTCLAAIMENGVSWCVSENN